MSDFMKDLGNDLDELIMFAQSAAFDPLHGSNPRGGTKDKYDEIMAKVAKLLAFKVYVHQRLDQACVPADPDPAGNKEHGCRISGRFTWLFEKLARATAEYERENQRANELAESLCATIDRKAKVTAIMHDLKSERDAALARVQSLEDQLNTLNERNP